MKKSQLIVGFFVYLLFTSFLFSKPMASTSLSDALNKAPIILLAETEKGEFDDLKEGVIVESSYNKYASQKRSYKVLKVYRHNEGSLLKEGSSISIPDKSGGCIDFAIKIEKVNDKLKMTYDTGEVIISEIPKTGKRVVLFLDKAKGGEEVYYHYGWLVSPSEYNDEIKKVLEK